ncbi:MAG: c-type cytochrome [Mariprofundaceae bacterium]|nr:c-type cytochrome [Mariprofundaceae bacterium]
MVTTLLFLGLLQGCGNKQLEAPKPPAVAQAAPDNWAETQKNRIAAKAAFISEHQAAFDWFANFAFSQTDGTPYIALKLLPVIAPEYWGSEENFLDAVGLFKDERQADYPIARGIGISGLAREKKFGNIDYASFTCAACHIGRVRTGNGNFSYIDGGVNSEFNIVQYRVRLNKTIQKIYGPEKDPEKQQQLAIDAFLKALQSTHAKDKTFFYKNYQTPWVTFDAEYEQKQIDLFTENSAAIISKFVERSVNNYTGFAALLDKNYSGFQSESLKGFPGMADATGISAVNGYIAAQQTFFTRLFSSFILPPKPGITDFMSVWEQDKRKAEWDEAHQTLINGGGQWNGNIPIPIYRNLAAQLTLGLNDNDIRVAAFGVELLDGLPASVYPFDVDVKLAKKGQGLFKNNCAQCHQPHNGKIYSNMGTNLDRSYVVNWLIRKGGIEGFSKVCSPTTTVIMAGKKVKPCAEFDGVSLQGKESIIMSPNDQHHGYSARPLSGIWAQAPYLHNGSVPTVYHLLVPSERPDTFIKSRLDYDQKLLGFSWQSVGNLANNKQEGYLFNTRAFPAFSNSGHDQNIQEGKHTYKLDWSDDKEGAKAIVEYLKTL